MAGPGPVAVDSVNSVLSDNQSHVRNRLGFDVEDHAETPRQQGLQHLRYEVGRGTRRCLGDDVEAHGLGFDPVRTAQLLVGNHAVGVFNAVGQAGVAEGERSVLESAEVDVDQVARGRWRR
jgi:hypothetical protein